MARIALGYLKWTEGQALAADVNAIQIGYEGHMDMLRDIFGSGEQSPQNLPEMTAGMLSRKG